MLLNARPFIGARPQRRQQVRERHYTREGLTRGPAWARRQQFSRAVFTKHPAVGHGQLESRRVVASGRIDAPSLCPVTPDRPINHTASCRGRYSRALKPIRREIKPCLVASSRRVTAR